AAAAPERLLEEAARGQGLGLGIDGRGGAALDPRGAKAPTRHAEMATAIGGDHDGHFERRRRVVAWGQLLRLLVLHADAEAPGELFEGRGLRVAAADRARRYAELFRNSRSARRDGAWRRGRGGGAPAPPPRPPRPPPGWGDAQREPHT